MESFTETADRAALFKRHLRRGLDRLHDSHGRGASGREVTAAWTALVDELLRALLRSLLEENPVSDEPALVALGGYGRAELNVRSDVDLMLLYRKRLTPELEALNEKMLYVLWDTGLDMGFSIRSVDECLSLARTDLKTLTSLFDQRLITGDNTLYDHFYKAVKARLFKRGGIDSFINEKLEEQARRHEKYGGSVYILEPNVKEGEGGLRDFHTACWIAKARGGDPLVEPAALGLLSESELRRIRDAVDFLFWVRNDLHFDTGRKTDQLTFDHQERIARLLGFRDKPHCLAVEAFMEQYYRHAMTVSHISGLVISRTIHAQKSRSFWRERRPRPIDDDFSIGDGKLFIRERAVAERPAVMIRAFRRMQEHGVGLSQPAREVILMNLRRMESAREEPEAAADFLDILRGPRVFDTLREMHNLRLLDKLIPEFGEIHCKVQHDRYHIYTVDIHTLFAVRELERLSTDEYASRFPLLARLYGEVTDRAVVFLGVLLHDIAKAGGRGHAERGAEMTVEICRRLRLPKEAARHVKFLVGNHLILADTAQYRDLHDDKLILDFARKVGSPERLDLLYLLTFADVRAVGPDVWNRWKGALFQELYFKARAVIERGTFEIEDAQERLDARKSEIRALATAVDPAYVEEYFGLLPKRYFLATPPEAVAAHMELARSLGGRPLVMKVRQVKERAYTELTICTYDTHGLFAKMAGVLAANSVNILGAQINTLRNGVVIDVLQVKSSYDTLIEDAARLERIERELTEVITGRARVEELLARRKPSILDLRTKPRVPTRVLIDNDVSDVYTVIDIRTQDRLGLLHDITSLLTTLGLFIHVAKITTSGDEAADIFYVKDIFGQKIYFKERLEKIKTALCDVIERRADGEETSAVAG